MGDGRESELLCVNGALVAREDFAYPKDELGWLRGYGVFETIYRYPAGCFHLDAHLQRLEDSAELLHIPTPTREELRAGLETWIEATPGLAPARVRLTLVLDGAGCWWMIDGQAVTPRPPLAERGLTMWTAHITVPPPPIGAAKTMSRVAYELAALEARARGADDALLPTAFGDLGESTRASVFLVVDGRLRTPPLELGILPGVTRQLLVDGFEAAGVEIDQAVLPFETVWDADELFVCSTVRGIAPVRTLLGDGDPPRRRDLPEGPFVRQAEEIAQAAVVRAGLA